MTDLEERVERLEEEVGIEKEPSLEDQEWVHGADTVDGSRIHLGSNCLTDDQARGLNDSPFNLRSIGKDGRGVHILVVRDE